MSDSELNELEYDTDYIIDIVRDYEYGKISKKEMISELCDYLGVDYE